MTGPTRSYFQLHLLEERMPGYKQLRCSYWLLLTKGECLRARQQAHLWRSDLCPQHADTLMPNTLAQRNIPSSTADSVDLSLP